MKCSMRVKLFVIIALLAAMFAAGSAWAGETEIAAAITSFGLARQVGESGNTITVVNASENPLRKDVSSITNYYLLNLGDITGITINWKANLTVTGKLNIDQDDGIDVILFQNGTFNHESGTIDIQTTGNGWTNAIEAEGNSTVTVEGGTVTGTGASHFGIDASKVIVKSGRIYFPYGDALSANELIVENPNVITGTTIVSTDNFKSVSIDIYGVAFKVHPDPTDGTSKIAFTVKDGATWTVNPAALNLSNIESVFLIEGNGTLITSGEGSLDIRGTLTNKGTFRNNSIINNYSGNTIDNQGTLTNNGTINNKSTGKVKNTGTLYNASNAKIVNENAIDNTGGTIKNDGTFQSAQTVSEMGGTVDGEVQPLNSNSGGSSGCNPATECLDCCCWPGLRRSGAGHKLVG